MLTVGVLTLSSSSGESYTYHADPINAQETLLVLLIVFAFFFLRTSIDRHFLTI